MQNDPIEQVSGEVEMSQTVFVNPEQCIGCRQCEFACAVEHSTSKDPAVAPYEVPTPRARVHVESGPTRNTSFPNRCRHCDPAPCAQVCPTGAITRDAVHELVLVEASKCIGCAMCAVVCPFDALTFHAAIGAVASTASTAGRAEHGADTVAVAVKCDGCVDRLTRGEEPACTEVCKAGALVFGDLGELIARGRVKESARIIAAVHPPQTSPSPGLIDAWRDWGVEQSHVSAALSHNGGGSR